MREVEHGPVDRDQRQIDRAGPHRDPPPVTVEEGVAEVQDPDARTLDEPRELRVAGPVGRRDRRDRERPELGALPFGEPPALEPGGVQLVVGLGEPELLEPLARAREWLEDRGAGGQPRGEGAGVGVIAMEVGQQGRRGPAPARGRDHVGVRDRLRLLAEGREDRARIRERIDQDRRPRDGQLEAGPAEPSDVHLHAGQNNERA